MAQYSGRCHMPQGEAIHQLLGVDVPRSSHPQSWMKKPSSASTRRKAAKRLVETAQYVAASNKDARSRMRFPAERRVSSVLARPTAASLRLLTPTRVLGQDVTRGGQGAGKVSGFSCPTTRDARPRSGADLGFTLPLGTASQAPRHLLGIAGNAHNEIN